MRSGHTCAQQPGANTRPATWRQHPPRHLRRRFPQLPRVHDVYRPLSLVGLAPGGLLFALLPEARSLAAPGRHALGSHDVRHAFQLVVDAERRPTVPGASVAGILEAPSTEALAAHHVNHAALSVARAEQRPALRHVPVARAAVAPVRPAARGDHVDHAGHLVPGAEGGPLPLEPVGRSRRARVVAALPGGDLDHALALVRRAVRRLPAAAPGPEGRSPGTARLLAPVGDAPLPRLEGRSRNPHGGRGARGGAIVAARRLLLIPSVVSIPAFRGVVVPQLLRVHHRRYEGLGFLLRGALAAAEAAAADGGDRTVLGGTDVNGAGESESAPGIGGDVFHGFVRPPPPPATVILQHVAEGTSRQREPHAAVRVLQRRDRRRRHASHALRCLGDLQELLLEGLQARLPLQGNPTAEVVPDDAARTSTTTTTVDSNGLLCPPLLPSMVIETAVVRRRRLPRLVVVGTSAVLVVAVAEDPAAAAAATAVAAPAVSGGGSTRRGRIIIHLVLPLKLLLLLLLLLLRLLLLLLLWVVMVALRPAAVVGISRRWDGAVRSGQRSLRERYRFGRRRRRRSLAPGEAATAPAVKVCDTGHDGLLGGRRVDHLVAGGGPKLTAAAAAATAQKHRGGGTSSSVAVVHAVPLSRDLFRFEGLGRLAASWGDRGAFFACYWTEGVEGGAAKVRRIVKFERP